VSKGFGVGRHSLPSSRGAGSGPRWTIQALKQATALAAPLPLQYLTEPWAEEALKRVESDDRIHKAIKGIEVSVLTIVLHPPKGSYGFVYTAFDGTGLKEYRVGLDYAAVADGIPPPTFVISGEYEVFAAVQRGEMTERKALLTGKLHLTGSMIKALRHMRALESITKVLQEIPCKT
jgi:hypothetical protein